ncbi:MAG: co-chaperone DjlA [Gammaproteobacteria bacterium]|nr:co-chaperone DjlA [Gammaproteobacteria bacterium]NIR90017.1 co-chaperone DjlA [Gammaproteobacteria bacterium]NIR99146.1 co-chaperone DjlA [Gammaproteobacteria bacterium]NIT64786.1 co-chaperone DjlA [Gammaproteobacteria bacterium]NIV53636.1 co-chaperone DjlA [Gammaproteobacteria bacterium]
MSWWGKVIGGAFGFLLGGPIGALLGAALGHNFDRGLAGMMREQGPGAGDPERVQAAFFTTTFSVMGYLAKADGRVSEHEIAMANQVMAHMRLTSEQRRTARRLFTEGKQPDFPVDEVLEQFRRECHRRRSLIQMFLEIQIMTALADGALHDREHRTLLYIGEHLGFARQAVDRLVAMVRGQQHFAGATGAGQPAAAASLDDAYAVLGISPRAGDDEVKRAYRRMMSQHHPDKLVAKGLPDEMMQLAKEKTQEIRAAYERIKTARGL